MRIIIPMAGRGTRVRPHSHVTPKPLLDIKGKNMVERIVDMFTGVLPRRPDDVVFIIGPDFGADITSRLTDLCTSRDITSHFVVQDRALGTAHAVHCARQYLEGEGIVVYADTLFDMEPGVNLDAADVIAWVKHVEDPRRFGVAVREGERVVAFVEKPDQPISNEALIGIYYIKELVTLRQAIDHIMENDLKGKGGEYFLTDAFDLMLQGGALFKTATVTEWLDCGTIEALMDTTRYILQKETADLHQGEAVNSIIIDPVYIGPGARIVNSVVGPNVSVENGAEIIESRISDTILFGGSRVEHAVLATSIVGKSARVNSRPGVVNIGDHSTVS